jgi:MFS family permease
MTDPMTEQVVATIGGQARGRARHHALRRALSPFRSAGYRRLAVALSLNMFASGVWIVAVVWEVIRLDGGPAQLSVVTTAGAIGVVLPALFAGVVADRVPQKSILLAVAVVELAGMALVAVLSLSDLTQLWHLAAVSFAAGAGLAFYWPAYTAWIPALVPESDLQAVNGFEGMIRPTIQQAIGPAVAGIVVGAASPAAAFVVASAASVLGLLALTAVPKTPVRRDFDEAHGTHPVRAALVDMKEGFAYMVRTPWLLSSLIFGSLMILVVMGPIEVLIPFLLKDRLGQGPGSHALVLAGFGIGGAIASILMGAAPMPRRYLTLMNLAWGVACLPMIWMGFASHVWELVVAASVCGALFSAPMVVWGTLLQRRVPAALVGRVSSLDFFVSLSLMPVSMALAGPVSEAIGLRTTFLVAGVVPLVVAVIAVLWARLPEDEIAHPLRDEPVLDEAA